MAISLRAISFDVKDVPRLSQFWAEVLDAPASPGGNEILAIIDIPGLRLMFHQVPEDKIVKNRLHPDLGTNHYDLDTDRLLKFGAVKLRDIEQDGRRWRTFADPEGNEFDLVDTAL
jgi:hypothetical protein